MVSHFILCWYTWNTDCKLNKIYVDFSLIQPIHSFQIVPVAFSHSQYYFKVHFICFFFGVCVCVLSCDFPFCHCFNDLWCKGIFQKRFSDASILSVYVVFIVPVSYLPHRQPWLLIKTSFCGRCTSNRNIVYINYKAFLSI